MRSKGRFRFILALLVGVALLFAVTRFINLATAIKKFDDYAWPWLPVVLVLSLAYYLLKALRWHYFLNVIDIRLPWRRSFLIYLGGQWFAFTPAGEFVRAYLLTDYGYGFGRGSAAVTVQVIFDFLSLAMLGSLSLLAFHELASLVLPFTVVLIAGVLGFAYGPALLGRRGKPRASAADRGLMGRWARFYEDSCRLLAWRCLLVGTVLGLLGVVAGAGVLFAACSGYQIEASLGQAAYIYSLSQLAGALSMLPHGLGAVEGSSVALFGYAGVDTAYAATAIVLFRLCTVGWGLLVGGASLLLLRTRWAGPLPRVAEAPDPVGTDAAGPTYREMT